MPLTAGTRLGPYEIVGAIGAGGMGEVYRARDTRLKREVAVKVLPDAFTGDPERESRFQREAEALAALSHPNIAAIHELAEANGSRFLVLELVEGDTLADRLTRGPLPLAEALAVAKQICDALEAAHEKGFVHRDLKPANVKVQGTVKLLDFGLAKMLEAEASNSAGAAALSNSPTMLGQTTAGVIVGTAAYMSPEQAQGRPADRQADVWAFGCVLFEMLTGKPAFAGGTVVEILSRVLQTDPDWTALPATTPPGLRSLLKRCMQKERRHRLRDIADARFQIEEASSEPVGSFATEAGAVRGPAGLKPRLLWTAVTLAALVTGAVVSALYFRRPPVAAPEMRLQIVTPFTDDVTSFAISPDGQKIVYRATTDGISRLWLRSFDSETANALPGTENGTRPFWSEDSQSIGFFAGGLKRIDVAGGLVQTLAEVPIVIGGTSGAWSRDGTIVFAPSNTVPLFRVPAGSGQAVQTTELVAPQTGHRYPHFLPDGRHFLFFALGPDDTKGVYVGSIESTAVRRLFDADSAAVFAPPDYALFARQGALLAQRLDLETFTAVDQPLSVTARVAVWPNVLASVAVSASTAGPIAYRANAEERQLTWFDRSGRQLETLGPPDEGQPLDIRLAPHGRTVSVIRRAGGRPDVWLLETARGVLQRLTSDAAQEYNGVWSPDGSRLVFESNRNGILDLYEKQVDGASMDSLLLATAEHKNTLDWSSDSRHILYASQTATTGRDIWSMPLFGDRKPFAVVQTAFEEAIARFSPDGRWIAFQSNETGRNEIYVQPFPGPGGKSQVSTTGGVDPRWRRDGRELYYVSPDNRLMAVGLTLTDQARESAVPQTLFSLPAALAGADYEAAPDGQRFLFAAITRDASPITVLLNWKPR